MKSYILFGSMTYLIVSLFAGCSGSYLASNWQSEQIAIDGDVGDWSAIPAYTEREDVRLSVSNDGEYFYLLLATQKREIARQIVLRGLTLWFDPNGGGKKTLGLNYPLGVQGSDMRYRDGETNPPERTEVREEISQRSLEEFEFLGPQERDRVRVPKREGKGVEVELSDEHNLFVYEVKIPLVFSLQHPYAIETSAGSTIGLTVEVGGSGMFARGTRGGDMPGGGGFPGGGRGRMGGGGAMRRPGGAAEQFEPMTIRVQLAEK